MSLEQYRPPEKPPEENLRKLGEGLVAYGKEVAPYIDPKKNMETTVRARTIMDIVGQQLSEGSHTVILPGGLIGADNDTELYYPLKIDGGHYLIVPASLKHKSDYGKTGILFAEKMIPFLSPDEFLLDTPFNASPTAQYYDPEWFAYNSATVMLPDTETNREGSWVDADACGFILGPRVSNFWDKVPWGGNPRHEKDHRLRAIRDPLGYFLGENPHSLFDEMQALQTEWQECRGYTINRSVRFQESISHEINRIEDIQRFNPFDLSRQLGMKIYTQHSYSSGKHPTTFAKIPDRNQPFSQDKFNELSLLTINQHAIVGKPPKTVITGFDAMDGTQFNESAYNSRTIFALWDEALQSSMVALMKNNSVNDYLKDLVRGEVSTYLSIINPLNTLTFCDFKMHFKDAWRGDLHRVIGRTNRHLTLTELMDTYYSSMTARLLGDILAYRNDIISDNYLASLVQKESPERLNKYLEIYRLKKIPDNNSPSLNVRHNILFPVLEDLVFERLLQSENMREQIERLWLRTAETFYDNTIAKMTASIIPGGLPLKYQEP